MCILLIEHTGYKANYYYVCRRKCQERESKSKRGWMWNCSIISWSCIFTVIGFETMKWNVECVHIHFYLNGYLCRSILVENISYVTSRLVGSHYCLFAFGIRCMCIVNFSCISIWTFLFFLYTFFAIWNCTVRFAYKCIFVREKN